jgi:outer membrane lipoprotein-sorting protein
MILRIITILSITILCNYSYATNDDYYRLEKKTITKHKPEIIVKELNNKQSSDKEKITKYFNNIKTLVADFIQISPNGAESTGKFFLMRPGKLRWQYDLPTPTLIVLNGRLLSYYDYELQELSHSNTEDIAGSFLIKPKIDFDNDVIIKDITYGAGTVKAYIHSKTAKQEYGSDFAMIFQSSPFSLKQIEILNDSMQKTIITFSNSRQDVELDKKLFIVTKEKNKRR